MFDIAPSEFVLIAAVAILCIGPKDMPRALRTAGRWMGKMRRMSNHLRSGMETMIREAELEEMEQKWREQNAAIMAAHSDNASAPSMENPGPPPPDSLPPGHAEPIAAEPFMAPLPGDSLAAGSSDLAPELPLTKPRQPRKPRVKKA